MKLNEDARRHVAHVTDTALSIVRRHFMS